MLIDMEAQIHRLEQEAYTAVLRAFKAQSDAITWEKEGLITELRKELRVSDDEHRDLLTRVNGDEIIKRIREWRQTGGHQGSKFGASQPVHDVLPSPTLSGSRKKQKTSQMGQALSRFPSMKYASISGDRHFSIHGEPAVSSNALIGRKLWMRWPSDNKFYEAVVTDYNPVTGKHCLVYDMNTEIQTSEWLNLKEVATDDIHWDGEDPGFFSHDSLGDPGRGQRRPIKSKKEVFPGVNGFARKVSDDIELLKTETLVKEVERVFGVSRPDPVELEKAKRMLKEHEQALVDAISRLADASDDESDGEQQFLHGQAMEQE